MYSFTNLLDIYKISWRDSRIALEGGKFMIYCLRLPGVNIVLWCPNNQNTLVYRYDTERWKDSLMGNSPQNKTTTKQLQDKSITNTIQKYIANVAFTQLPLSYDKNPKEKKISTSFSLVVVWLSLCCRCPPGVGSTIEIYV